MIESLSWITRGLFSLSTLFCAGTVFLIFTTASQLPHQIVRLRRFCGYAAIVSLCLAALWWLSLVLEFGGEWNALSDPYYYELLASSAASELLLWRVVALLGLLFYARNTAAPHGVAVVFSLIAIFSFTRYGHALSDPQWLRTLLLTVHLSIIAWWFAVVPTLLTLLSQAPSSAIELADRFSRQASIAVPVALLCGLGFALLTLSSDDWDFQSLYAKTLVLKLLLVSCVLGIGALNRHYLSSHHRINPLQNKNTLQKILILDAVLFVSIILLSAWLTGPASNG